MCNCLNCGKPLEKNQKKFCSVTCQNEYKGVLNRIEYKKHPNYCKHCGNPLPFEKRKNKFCCSSCSVKENNSKRIPPSDKQREKAKSSLFKHFDEIGHVYAIGTKSKNAILTCRICGEKYKIKDKNGATHSFCSSDCRKKYFKNKKNYLSEDALKKLSNAGKKSAFVQGDKRRSKNEIYFFELCKKHFSNVKHNEPIFNGWDADIIIEDIKYAILWNGVWHYKKIGKGYPLEKVKNRDRIKINEIIKCGYIPYIIKDLHKENKDFVEKQFKIFIESIAV